MGRIPASASYTGQCNALIHSFKKQLSIEIKFLDIENSIMMRIKSLLSIITVDFLSFYYVRTNTHTRVYTHTYTSIHAKHYSQCFPYILVSNPLPHTAGGRYYQSSSYRWWNWETEKLSNLPKITQPRSGHQNQSPELADFPASTLRHNVILTNSHPGSPSLYTDDIAGTIVKSSHLCNMRKREPCSLTYLNLTGFSYLFGETKLFLCP